MRRNRTLFAWLKIPLPWMTGPLLAMAVCNFAGAQLRSAPGARSVGQIVIGTALGLYFTPVVGREVAQVGGCRTPFSSARSR